MTSSWGIETNWPQVDQKKTRMWCKLCINYVFLLAGKTQLVQKKKTICPEWNTSFDAHLYDGRVIHMIVMQRPNQLVADISISAQDLADKCKDGGVASIWVSDVEIWSQGHVMMT